MKISQKKLNEIVKRYKPNGVKVKWYKPENTAPRALKGFACYEQKLILSPKVECRNTLYLFLHEAGHFKTGHLPLDLPCHVEEFEAELWAMNVMRTEGIPIPKEMLREIKRYVKECISFDISKGINIRPHIKKWASRK